MHPVQAHQRVAPLDILRGFSLLGILLVNIIAFYVPMPHVIDISSWFTEARDIINYQYLEIYVQGSFYPLFSMLFGYGIAMQFIKANNIDERFYGFASKRLVLLLILGLIHAFFIWWGDILATYAFCGFFLLLFIRLSAGWLLTIAVILNVFFHFSYLSLLNVVGVLHEEVSASSDIIAIQDSITAYGTGTWSDTFVQRLSDLSIQLSPIMWIVSLFTILPYMLVGAAASKWLLIERAQKKWKLWLVLAIVCTAMGLVIKNAPILYTRTNLLEYLSDNIGGPILSIGYIAIIVCVCLSKVAVKVLSPIAKMGRMSLTMYLMQSILLSVLFYNWGFGLYGQVDVELGIYIAITIYVVQIIIAELWLSKFKQGPIEALMKKVIYGKILSEK